MKGSIIRLFFFLISLQLIFLSVNSVEVKVDISENISVTKLLIGKYSLDAYGSIEIYNPSLTSRVYEYSIPLNLDSLIGISKINLDNTSSNFDFTYNRIKGYLLEPNQTIKVGYHIYGLLDDNLLNKLNGSSALEYYSDFEFSGKTILNLQKPEREGEIYNATNGQLISSEGNISRRLISTEIENPTDFSYSPGEVKLYGSNASDPMFSQTNKLKTFQNVSLSPFQKTTLDFFDINSNSNSVYWVSSRLFIDVLANRVVNTNYDEEIAPSSGGTSSGSSGGSSGGGGFFNKFPNLKDAVLIKKKVEKSLVLNGEEIEVILTIVNIKDFDIENLTILDEVPEDYEITNTSDSVKLINGNKLNFSINRIGKYSTKIIKYSIKPKNSQSGITYLKPAELRYDKYKYFSEGVLVIHDLLPDKKVFLQKKIDPIDDKFTKITIKIKNLGSIPIEDILLTENIDDNAIIKDLSKLPFERGSWKINKLLPGEEWEVSYLIEKEYSSQSLPNIFGVEQDNVYGTLISSEEIITVFKDQPRTIEKVGMFISVGLLIIYLLF